ncbi:hypothetical protein KY335_04400 [Candidatus Woesearchaeota archaeon]|nr:hypothetical protein [Candidatus Woesearchaeota archaeon]
MGEKNNPIGYYQKDLKGDSGKELDELFEKLQSCLLFETVDETEYEVMIHKLNVMERANPSNRFLETEHNPIDKVGVDFMTNQPKYTLRYKIIDFINRPDFDRLEFYHRFSVSSATLGGIIISTPNDPVDY